MALRSQLKFSQSWLIIALASIVLAILSSFTTYVNSRVTGRTDPREILFVASLWLAVLMFAPSAPFASAALRCDLVVTGLTRGQESTFGQHKGREIPGPKENLFPYSVSTLLTHGFTRWHSNARLERGFEQSESNCKKMGEQRRCQTSHFGNESDTA
jgi:hypothetical protein